MSFETRLDKLAPKRHSVTEPLISLKNHEMNPELFGHPRGLSVLFGTEMWERFSYYGMRSILILYMTDIFSNPKIINDVLGFSFIYKFLFSTSSHQAASNLYGLYTALVYVTPIFGGIVADKYLSRRYVIIFGAILMALGHFLMTVESLFLIALLTIIVGNGAFKPNINSQVGLLYSRDDQRRDSAFSIFYVGINIGAFLAPIVCGTLGERAGWPFGFAAAGIGMIVALTIYLVGEHFLRETPNSSHGPALSPPKAEIWSPAIILFIPALLFWAAYEQIGNTVVIWTQTSINRFISIGSYQFMIPILTPLLTTFWRNTTISNLQVSKMAFACVGLSISYVILAYANLLSGGSKIGSAWLILFYITFTLSELFLSP
jgi:POT family proton-dependent oligopeptide transporter